MEIFPLPANEFAEKGWTHSFKFTWDDDLNVSSTTTTIAMYSAAAGEAVYDCALYLSTDFSTPGDRTTMTLEVGDGSDPNRFLTSAQTLASQTKYALSPIGTTTHPHVYQAADTVDLVATLSGGTTGNLDALTAGEFWIALAIRNLNEIKQDSRG